MAFSHRSDSGVPHSPGIPSASSATCYKKMQHSHRGACQPQLPRYSTHFTKCLTIIIIKLCTILLINQTIDYNGEDRMNVRHSNDAAADDDDDVGPNQFSLISLRYFPILTPLDLSCVLQASPTLFYRLRKQPVQHCSCSAVDQPASQPWCYVVVVCLTNMTLPKITSMKFLSTHRDAPDRFIPLPASRDGSIFFFILRHHHRSCWLRLMEISQYYQRNKLFPTRRKNYYFFPPVFIKALHRGSSSSLSLSL